MNNFEKNKDTQEENNITTTPDDFSVGSAIKQTPESVNNNELDTAKKEALESDDVYKHKFSTPPLYLGNPISEISFNWNSLTGNDGLSIENELQANGKVIIIPTFSGEFLIRMAARASSPRVGSDFFEAIPLADYNKIRNAARSFLLKSE